MCSHNAPTLLTSSVQTRRVLLPSQVSSSSLGRDRSLPPCSDSQPASCSSDYYEQAWRQMNQAPSKGALIFLGVVIAFWVIITCLGAKHLAFDKALSNPATAAITNAEVIEYRFPGHGGWATYRFVAAGAGSSFTNRGSIDRRTYNDLASGRARTITVHYLRDDPIPTRHRAALTFQMTIGWCLLG
jgi:hypothetical protein